MSQYEIVMIRHGESVFNEKNLFCGWYNANLSEKGKHEAIQAGKTLRNLGYTFDIGFTSVLKRANDTLDLIVQELCQKYLRVIKTWRLNERHYGALTGLNKADTVKEYGEEQVNIWRRSYDVPPPPMDENHRYYNPIVNNPIYDDGPSVEEFPKTESLKLTMQRTLPFWKSTIIPTIQSGKKVIIAAHGNSLRGIIKHLDKLSDKEIMEINLPTGIPFTYTLNSKMKAVKGKSMQFLGDEETVRKAIEEVANQGKSK